MPDFLRDYTENILNIGKSVRLLTYFIADRRDITGKSFVKIIVLIEKILIKRNFMKQTFIQNSTGNY